MHKKKESGLKRSSRSHSIENKLNSNSFEMAMNGEINDDQMEVALSIDLPPSKKSHLNSNSNQSEFIQDEFDSFEWDWDAVDLIENKLTDPVAKMDLKNEIENEMDLKNWGLPKDIVNGYLREGISKLYEWQVSCLKSNGSRVLNGGNLQNRWWKNK